MVWYVVWGVVVVGSAAVFGLRLRTYLRSRRRWPLMPVREPEEPTLYTLAALSGGRRRVAETALAALYLAGMLKVPVHPCRVELSAMRRPLADPVQAAAVALKERGSRYQNGRVLLERVTHTPDAIRVEADLVERGLIVDQEARARTRSDRSEVVTVSVLLFLAGLVVCGAQWWAQDRFPLRWAVAHVLLWTGVWLGLSRLPLPRPGGDAFLTGAGEALRARLAADREWAGRPLLGSVAVTATAAPVLADVAHTGSHVLADLRRALVEPVSSGFSRPKPRQAASGAGSGTHIGDGGVGGPLGGGCGGCGGCGGGF
ncbi:TIGR04222 domain-containing membrane protein [Streptomyces sp. NPDC003314]